MSRALYEDMTSLRNAYLKRKEEYPALSGDYSTNAYIKYENEVEILFNAYQEARKRFEQSTLTKGLNR